MIFWFHYNKQQSKKHGKPIMTLHYKKTCHYVENVIINVPTWGHLRNDQPRFVIKGAATSIEIKDGIAKID